MKTYRISSSGRRTALILLIGALIIWAFAIWTFGSTLGISYDPRQFLSTLRQSVDRGLSISQIVPALLMLVLIVATPLVIWNIAEELAASYGVADDGLHFASLGIRLTYPWAGVSAIRHVDEDSDEPMDELTLQADYTSQIHNRLLRFLHAQAYGRRKLPIYAGIADRDELLDEIKRYVGQAVDDIPASAGGEPEAGVRGAAL